MKEMKSSFPSLLSEYVDIKVERKDPVIETKKPKQLSLQRSSLSGVANKNPKHKVIENERLEKIADIWDLAKAEVEHDQQKVLRQKVLLQRALIAAQDARAQQLREEEGDVKFKKRNEDKRLKDERLASLQTQFKKSIDSERKSKQNQTNVHHTPDKVESKQRVSEEKNSSIGPAASSKATLTVREHREEHEGQMEQLNHTSAHGSQSAQGPSLHTNSRSERRKLANSVFQNLQGHLGAEHIWTQLRSDSINKLEKADQLFPKTLKDAFSAHVREGITKHKKPVFRNFTINDDVPDLKLLMDQSLLRSIRTTRHKTELMFRSSQTNKDRTKILMYNSTWPDVAEGESISKYLIPIDVSTYDGAQSEQSYKKWITRAAMLDAPQDEKCATLERYSTPVLGSVDNMADHLHNVWSSANRRKEPRYHFLTEKEATVKGSFFNKGKDNQHIVRQNQMQLPSLQQDSSEKVFEAQLSRQASKSLSKWEPLSMNALIEYKEQILADGFGEFQHGRSKMWNMAAASSQ
ncbi:uncharacterized protein LOC131938265 [Physella acuta]|uniref:uncharacterized protein LOC131938265 n=1 Tax=Physella acuta TaxID=109671 RepID=UPI0027DD270F|nr:uncharacterized protein LOC131938265 [Physella acuta]XP_059152203.1 uncharacterized protein LOC131938265 [Physella acuta]